MRFDLAIETGPRHRKTMVHVPSLPGSITIEPTTEAAVDAAPAAIRQRLVFLRRHGDEIPNAEPIEVVVTEEDTSGAWLGFGVAFFASDRLPISSRDVYRQLAWATWSRQELLDVALSLALGGRAEAVDGRHVADVLRHVAGSESAYLGSLVGPVPGMNAARTAVERATDDLYPAMNRLRTIVVDRLSALSENERSDVVDRGKELRTARRALRRMLEHEWEHLLELQARLPR
jgi:predicted RNase H-like HicB family nuclease